MENNIFPFLDPSLSYTNDDKLPLFKEIDYDFEVNKISTDKYGNILIVTGIDAIKIWILKTLMTPRAKYEIYTYLYGNDFEMLIGEMNQKAYIKSEIKRYIKEALLVNYYIKDLSNFKIEFEGSKIYISFKIHTIYGEGGIDYDYSF